MAITKTTTDVEQLKINVLTQEMFEDAESNDQLNENEIYLISGADSFVAAQIVRWQDGNIFRFRKS